MTLRTRIALAAGVAVALTVVGLGAADYVATRSALLTQIDAALDQRAAPYLNPGTGRGHDGGGPPGFEATPGDPFGGPSGVLQRVLPSGQSQVPPDQTATLPVDAATRAIAVIGRGTHRSDVTVQGVHLRVLAVGVGTDGAIQIARPLTESDSTLARLVVLLVALGALGILVAAVLGAVVARTALTPVTRFTRRTEAIAGDLDLSARLDASRSDELGRLAASFNATLDSLERSVASQRHLVADASHELRTPIASIRANVQMLDEAARLPQDERDALRADIVSELDELTALVADIVELARDGERTDAPDDVRLDEIAAGLVERFQRRFGDAVTFTAELEPTLVRGDPERLARAVQNLLDNARKWSPPGGVVEVDLRDRVLRVRDHGPGFDEADLPHVFDRFYRARAARGMAGSGLGLAIVRQAIEAHGGQVEAGNAPDGGAVVRIVFAA